MEKIRNLRNSLMHTIQHIKTLNNILNWWRKTNGDCYLCWKISGLYVIYILLTDWVLIQNYKFSELKKSDFKTIKIKAQKLYSNTVPV